MWESAESISYHFPSFFALWSARAPNQCSGLACADQGHLRAALDRHGFLGDRSVRSTQ